jgi:hypothetical protein
MGEKCELELELIHTYMAKKPLLWVEAGAHAVGQNVLGWCGQAWVSSGACVCVVFEKNWAALAPLAFFMWCSSAGGCVQSTADL